MWVALHLLLCWVVVYTIVTGALMAIAWLGIQMPLPFQTLLLTLFLVPMMVMQIGPQMARLAGRIDGRIRTVFRH